VAAGAGTLPTGLRPGRKAAMPTASTAAAAQMPRITRKAFCEGSTAGPRVIVMWASTTPARALDTDVPMDRVSVFRLLAAAVSDTGTAPVTSDGMAP
jgi:hypothetical protein